MTLLTPDIEKDIIVIENLESQKDFIQKQLNNMVFKNNHDYENDSIKLPSYQEVEEYCSQSVYDDIINRIHHLIGSNHGLGTYCLFEILKDGGKSKELFLLVAKSIDDFSSQDGENFLILETAKSFFKRGIFKN